MTPFKKLITCINRGTVIKKLHRLLSVVLILYPLFCPAQKSTINYFNQQLPGMEARLFAPGIVSTSLYEHSAPAFSPDGSIVLWAVYDGKGYLLESRYENGSWSTPAKASFIDTLYSYVYPSFSVDGKKLYFSADLKVPPGYRQGNGNRIWEVERKQKGWGTPTPFDTTVSQGNNYAHSMSKNGTLYFSSSVSAQMNWSIRRSVKKNGHYSTPEVLPYDINSKDYEDGPYIAPDESFLIFESQRPDGVDGNLSLFIAFKNKNGKWRRPVNMGPKINSGKGERFARLSPDGKYLFFGSFRNPQPGSRGADIYWIDASVITELRNQQPPENIIEEALGLQIIAALENKDNIQVAVLMKQWLQTHPRSLDALVLYSAALRRQERFQEAEKLLKADSSKWNNNSGVLLEWALLKYGLNDEEGAITILAPVLSQPMDLRKKYSHLSDELFLMKKYQASDEYFDLAFAIRPSAIALYNRGCAYALTGEKDKAFNLLNKAIENGFNDRSTYETDKDLQSLQTDARWKELGLRLN